MARRPLGALVTFSLRVVKALASRKPWVLGVLALLLVSPSLASGWVADDYIQQLSLRRDPGIAGLEHRPFDLFRFADGDERAAHRLMDAGVFPWWADPRIKLAFFRPLSSVTHYLDYQLWPSTPALMHGHSLGWFALLLGSVALILKRFAGSASAGTLAFALFCLDDAHAPVVGWLANRNMLVALALSLPALLFHDDWRTKGRRSSAVMAHAALACGLLAGESASMVLAYLGAYALFRDAGPVPRRAASLLGYLCVTLLWRQLYDQWGYGVSGSGLYVDPLQDPWRFAQAAAVRLPVLLLSMVALPWSDLWEIYPLLAPRLQPAIWGLALVVLVACGALLRPLLREQREARFWLAGCLGAALPACATFPHDRLLLGPSLGAMALIAEFLARAMRRRQAAMGASNRVAVCVLVGLHVALAPALCLGRSASVGYLDDLLRAQDTTISKAPSIRAQTLVLLNPPLDPFAAYFSAYREVHGIARPANVYWLATGVSELRVSGVDDKTLLVRPRGAYLSSSSQRMLRNPSRASAYHPVALRDVSFQVTALSADGRPTEVRVHFPKGLRHASLSWFEWSGTGYIPFVPPAPGVTVVIPAVDLGAALWG